MWEMEIYREDSCNIFRPRSYLPTQLPLQMKTVRALVQVGTVRSEVDVLLSNVKVLNQENHRAGEKGLESARE